TIIHALLLLRLRQLHRMAQAQIGMDLVSATLLVHLTGGTESVFVFLFLLVLIGAATVLSMRATIAVTTLAVLFYAGIVTGRQLLPAFGQVPTAASPRELFRNIAVYA